MKYIYLAGPIAGCTEAEANDWRHDFALQLAAGSDGQIVGISPLRCEPVVGERYELNYADPKFGIAGAIAAKNDLDTRSCDLVLAYLPRSIRPSYGTIIELAWARAHNKPVVLVTDDPYIREHPLVSYCSSWVLADLEDAMEVILGVFLAYGRGA